MTFDIFFSQLGIKMLSIYIIEGCPYCVRAMDTLNDHGVKYTIHVVKPNKKDYYKKKHRHSTFPQFILRDDKNKFLLGGSEAVPEIIKVWKNKI